MSRTKRLPPNKGADKEKKAPFMPDFLAYGTDFFYNELTLLDNEKNKEKFIFIIERYIRTSLEYRAYIKYLKTEALLTQCVVMNMLPEEVAARISIEMHHCPLTLYDLVDIVLTKYLLLEKPFTRLSIANEVMDAHYMNQIGLVPMTTTMHQMIHSGTHLVNAKDLFGGYKVFAENYATFLTDDHQHKIEKVEKLDDEFVSNLRKHTLALDESLFLEHDDIDQNSVDIPETNESEEERSKNRDAKLKKVSIKSIEDEFEED